MKRRIAVPVVFSVYLLVTSVSATLISVPPNADTYVEFGDFDDPSATHGSETALGLGRSSVFTDFAILIQFDLSAVPSGATINSATLRMFPATNTYGPTDDQFELSYIAESWNENTVSGDTAPNTLSSTLAVGSSATPSINVILFVEDWVNNGVINNGFFIQNSGFNNFGDFISREGIGANPSLEIDYSIPEPSSMALSFLGVLGLLKWVRRYQA